MAKALSVAERIEEVRQRAGLNKSSFSHSLGMSAQTYAAFAASRNSMPNLELVLGIVTQFNVNPTWLLCGTGPVYLAESGAGPATRVTASPAAQPPASAVPGPLATSMSEADWVRANVLREIGSLQAEVRTLSEACQRISERLERAFDYLEPGALGPTPPGQD